MPGSDAVHAAPTPRAPQVLFLGAGERNELETLRQAAERRTWLVAQAADLEAAIEQCTSHWPSLAVVDLTAMSLDDADIMLTWLRRHARVPVLCLTEAGDADGRLLALRHGVDDHTVVPVRLDELEARVLTLLGRLERAQMRMVGDLTLDRAARRISRRGHEVHLTPSETTLLARLMVTPGEVVDKQELHKAMRARGRTENLVEVHLSTLRRKLDSTGPAVIHTVHGAGYVFRPTPHPHNGRRRRDARPD